MSRTLATVAGLVLAAAALSAQASVIAVFGGEGSVFNSSAAVAEFLNKNGHNAKDLGMKAPEAPDLVGVDTVIAVRAPGNDAVKDFVLGGGLLITEWNAADWALNKAQLLNAEAGANSSIGFDALITFTAAGLALGLGDNVGDSYRDAGRTENLIGLKITGTGVEVLGTHSDVQLGGFSGKGYVLINGLDWADGFATAPTGFASGQWLLNAVAIQPTQAVPEPGSLALLGLALTCLTALRRRA